MLHQSASKMLLETSSANMQHRTISQMYETIPTNYSNAQHRSPVQDISDRFSPAGMFTPPPMTSPFSNYSKENTQQTMILPNLRELLNESPPSHVSESSPSSSYPRHTANTQQQHHVYRNSPPRSYYSNPTNIHPNLGHEKIPFHQQASSQPRPRHALNGALNAQLLHASNLYQPPQHPYPPHHQHQHQPQTQQSSQIIQNNVSLSASSSRQLSPPQQQQQTHVNNNEPINMNRTIQDLERELNYQSRFIAELERENTELKRELMHVKQKSHLGGDRAGHIRSKNDAFETKKRSYAEVQPATPVTTYLTSSVNDVKKRKTNNITSPNVDSNKEFSIVDESVDKLNTANMDKYIVKWKGETYVLVSIFKNRTQILNYYVPLYQSQNPDKICKIVLSNEDYKQLSNENPETVEKKKHAWRVSVFTLDFYNFVKNFQKKNHKSSSFIPFDASAQKQFNKQ